MKIRILFLVCFSLLFPPLAKAASLTPQETQPPLTFTEFQKIPIQHEGRIKPLDSFARHITRQLNQKDEIAGMPAIEFLAEAVFNPARVVSAPLFQINHAEIKSLLDLNQEKTVFTLAEIWPPLRTQQNFLRELAQRDERDLSRTDRALLRLYNSAADIKQLTSALAFILPLNIPLPDSLAQRFMVNGQNITYLTIKKIEEPLLDYIETLSPDSISPQLKAFLLQLSLIERSQNLPPLFTIMPPPWHAKTQTWLSPWSLIQNGQGGPQSSTYLQKWKEMAVAYRSRDIPAWNSSTRHTYDHALELAQTRNLGTRLNLETAYHQIRPYDLSLLFYGLCLLVLIPMAWKPELALNGPAGGMLAAGWAFHLLALIMRVQILERPPVSTLYESIIFVGAVSVFCTLMIAVLRRESTLPLLVGSLSGILLHLVSFGFASRGDTFEVLTAVLNTNFWLATHVLVITAGYGLCLIAALLGHIYLIQRLLNQSLTNLVPLCAKMALAALLFTTIGTILGGIWADQSWGRFWGWDPKENGALLIVLWLIWLIHGKITGQINELFYMSGMAGLSIVVALAWFGVNLLSTGLHSYGFTSGIALSLGLYCATELFFIAVTASVLTWRRKRDARQSERNLISQETLP